MQRRQTSIFTALLLGVLTAPLLNAQTPPTNAPAPPVRLAGPSPKGPNAPSGPPAPKPQSITSLTTLGGTVNQLTANEDGILNGFTLNVNSGTTAVRFAPNLGQQVNSAIKSGSQVSVTGYAKTNPQGETTFQVVKLDAGKTRIMDSALAKPQPAATPTQQTITGKIADYQLGRDGKANGLILSDQTVVKVPPHLAGQLVTLAPKGSTVTVDGYLQPLGDGQVQLQKRTILRASVLTVGDQSYLVL